MTPIKVIVKDPKWQKVRKSLLGKWKTRPDWCCMQLRKYLGPINKTTNDKLRIVQNYLSGSGFRMGKIKHDCILTLRMEVKMEIHKRRSKNLWK